MLDMDQFPMGTSPLPLKRAKWALLTDDWGRYTNISMDRFVDLVRG